MHLVGPHLTTTRYNSKKKQSNSKKLAKAKEDHEAWLKSKGVGKSTLPVDRKGKRVGLYDVPDLMKDIVIAVKTSDKVGNGSAKETKVYTGNEIAGIAVTHKSNLMPIRKDNKQAAIDIAQMRRN